MDHQNQLYLHTEKQKKHRNVGKLNWLTRQVSWNLGGHRVVWTCCRRDSQEARWACQWSSAGQHGTWAALWCQGSTPVTKTRCGGTPRWQHRPWCLAHHAMRPIIFSLTVAAPHCLIYQRTYHPQPPLPPPSPSCPHPTKLMRFWAMLPRYRTCGYAIVKKNWHGI